ncbi:hypothetical protein C8F01DRAFT_1163512 [Mycena amicta]|nr:hypothetical protein C8F01DRAFT_1163512 [Mycena amicta]
MLKHVLLSIGCSEFVPQGPSPPFMEGATVLPPAADERRYIIRADTYYDPGTQILTALLELPARTLFNRQRQVTIQGYSRAFFPPSASALRERKYGRFTRNFPVPEDTRPEDIDAAMEDGVLVLRINCGVPATNADEHEIPIR